MADFAVQSPDTIALISAAPSSMLILLPDTPRFTIAAATDDYLRITYTQRAEILGKGIFDVFPDNPGNPLATGVKNLYASLNYVLEHKQPHRMPDQRYDIRNSTTGEFEAKVWRPLNKPFLDEQGNVLYIFHWVEDVTENVHLKLLEESTFQNFLRSEQELRKSNERFRLLNMATQDAVWDWDLITNLIWWNEGFKTLFGYRDEEIEPGVESWYNRVHPEDRDRVISGIHSVIDNGGKNWSDEYRFRKHDGSYAIVFDRGYALHDTAGKPYRMLGSIIDITERKKMEDAARESETRTRLAVESARLGTFEINMEAQTIIYSPRVAEIFGLDSSRQHPYSSFAQAILPDDLPIRRQAHAAALQTGKLFYEARIVHPGDGSLHWIRVNGILPLAEHQKLLIGTVLDITEEKRAAELLEQKIEERTRELKLANEQLKQFTYAASHDLQEPLRKISFFVDRLLSHLDLSDNAEGRNMACRIQHTVKRMRTLIDDLLSYSNTTQGKMISTEVCLNEVVQEVLDDMEATVIEKEAVVDVADLPCLQGDPRQLKQLFQNLVSNALKYHKWNEVPQVQISWRKVKGADVQPSLPPDKHESYFAEISVQDNGIGFSREDAGRIFGLFQRLHGRAEYEGTGIGLAIVQKVVDNHNGIIQVESEPGKGSRFKMILPAR